jgi:hypothetical protein
MLVDEKRALSLEELDAQVAFELPEREVPDTIRIILINGNVLPVQVRARDVNVFLNLCAQLVAILAIQRCKLVGSG